MYVLVALLLLIGVYGIYEYKRTVAFIEKGKLLSQQAIPYTTTANHGTATMLVVGDSTAVGVGSSREQSVPARVSIALGVSVENNARSGASIHDVRLQIQDASQKHYDLILIQAGANDIMSLRSYSEIENEAQQLLRDARMHSDRVVLLTAGDIGKAYIWPFPLNHILSHRTKKVRTIMQSLADNHDVVYVDLYTLPDPFATDPERYYAADFLHLSADGYGVWAEHVLNAIQKQWPELYEEKRD